MNDTDNLTIHIEVWRNVKKVVCFLEWFLHNQSQLVLQRLAGGQCLILLKSGQYMKAGAFCWCPSSSFCPHAEKEKLNKLNATLTFTQAPSYSHLNVLHGSELEWRIHANRVNQQPATSSQQPSPGHSVTTASVLKAIIISLLILKYLISSVMSRFLHCIWISLNASINVLIFLAIIL